MTSNDTQDPDSPWSNRQRGVIRKMLAWVGGRLPDPAPIESTEDRRGPAPDLLILDDDPTALHWTSGRTTALRPVPAPTSAEMSVEEQYGIPPSVEGPRLRIDPMAELRAAERAELKAKFEAAASKPAHAVVLPPGESEIVAAWLLRVRGEYEPWARRHVHTLIDELIDRARREAVPPTTEEVTH